jgi:soluble lytic murein transglycosylase-like protein
MHTSMRYLLVAALLILPAHAALAREHSHHHRGVHAAEVQAPNFFGLQLPFVFGAPAQPQRVAHDAVAAPTSAPAAGYESLVAQQASANGVPASLIHRVIMRESRYNPRAVSGGNYGLMQIRLGTARSMGYAGSAEGLLDANTNMTYAVRYLAGAYRAAGGNESRAVALYARGYSGG